MLINELAYACDVELQEKNVKSHYTCRWSRLKTVEYINNHTSLQWKCHQGHIWHAVLNTIENRNSWCPKLNIDIAKEIALKKGGKCLSEKYILI